MVMQGYSTKLLAGVRLAVPRLGNVRLRLHFLRRGTSGGGTAKGRPNGRDVHLHYQIERYNPETKKWEAIDPTEGKGNSKENILDPQILVDEYKSKQPSGPNQVPLDNFRRFNNIANKIIPILNSALKLIPKLLDLKPKI